MYKERKEKENIICKIPSITPNINQLSFLCVPTSRRPLPRTHQTILYFVMNSKKKNIGNSESAQE